ncbi:Abi family protein [Carnobacterium maltaromaticum]|uniref:Abi family protein n=1 Tax=Carnobacterium maltaromaticum TaxID=2751 RepID=UPI00295F45B4|nr:Abi family protein [Carnobacterium maltaromaticum]
MGVKIKKNRDELIQTLIQRNLKLDYQYTNEVLKKINYFQLINGFETLLLPDKNNKKFDTESFDDFVSLYEFNNIFTDIIFKKTTEFESRLKTSVAHHFCSLHCATLNDTMQYTNKNNYQNPHLISNYPFNSYQNRSICLQFDKFSFFHAEILTKLVKNNDWIDPRFYRDDSYLPPNDVATYKYDDKVAVPLWVAIQTIDFGTLKRMCHYVGNPVMQLILNDFGLSISQRDVFLNSIDIIHELRNKCAHTTLMYRFSTPKNIKINSRIITELNMNPKETNTPASILSLYDALKVLGYYENIDDLKNPLKRIIYRNNKHFKKKSYDLNERLLIRMGEASYKNWKKMLSNEMKYSLK